MIEIIPVIDLKGGVVVHAIGGQRERYCPVVSRLTTSSRPGDVAAAFAALGARQVYVADLDAIAGNEPDFAAYKAISETGLRLWLDAGVRHPEDARHIAQSIGDGGALDSLVIGLETLATTAALCDLLSAPTAARMVLSLDHRNGQPLTQIPAWRTASVVDIACEAAGLGVRRFIDLDLARVGSGDGPQGRGLADQLRHAHKDAFIAVGGGVRSAQDLTDLAEMGYDAALVATALHDGSIAETDLRQSITDRVGSNPNRARAFRETP